MYTKASILTNNSLIIGTEFNIFTNNSKIIGVYFMLCNTDLPIPAAALSKVSVYGYSLVLRFRIPWGGTDVCLL